MNIFNIYPKFLLILNPLPKLENIIINISIPAASANTHLEPSSLQHRRNSHQIVIPGIPSRSQTDRLRFISFPETHTYTRFWICINRLRIMHTEIVVSIRQVMPWKLHFPVEWHVEER